LTPLATPGSLPAMRRAPTVPTFPTRHAAAAAVAAALSGCGARDAGEPPAFERPETAVDYAASLDGAPSDEIDAVLRESLATFRRQADGAQSMAFLRRRAQGDAEIAARVLRSFGYYQSSLDYAVTPPDGDAPAAVALTLRPGAPFVLARHAFVAVDDGGAPLDELDPRAFGSPVGRIAAAGGVLNAEAAAVEALRSDGRPYARAGGRDAVADMEASTIEIDSVLVVGPQLTFGEIRFEGLERVEADYLETYKTWEQGAPFDMAALRDFQRALSETQLFSAVSAAPPETPPETGPGGGSAPVIVRAEEGPRRSATAGVRFSTDKGPSARASLQHRNLFGRNETGRITADVGLEDQRARLDFRAPQYLRPGQDFVSSLEVRQSELDAFDELAATLAAGFERRLDDRWTVGAGGLLEVSEIDDGASEERFLLAGLPVTAAYDGSDDLLNPTEGARLRLDATPFIGRSDDGDTPMFTRLEAIGSAYLALDEARRYVLAGRARAASILSDEVTDVPANRRLFSGGGGSVRGYAQDFIGPLDANGDPVGGLSALEMGTELRAQIRDPFGVALFVEGGAVSEDAWPSFSDGAQFAAGLGLRYLSPVGPLRLDVGVPMNPRDEDDAFQVYLSIGQAY
jgi:translocation and assembly module TamA